jgi:hypothetical protein
MEIIGVDTLAEALRAAIPGLEMGGKSRNKNDEPKGNETNPRNKSDGPEGNEARSRNESDGPEGNDIRSRSKSDQTASKYKTD